MSGHGRRFTRGASAVLLGIALGCASPLGSFGAPRGSMHMLTAVAVRRAAPQPVLSQRGTALMTYAAYAHNAVMTLEQRWLTESAWRMCLNAGCPITNQDWGADALTYDLYLDWQTTRDPAISAVLHRLSGSTHDYRVCHGSTCTQWSDVPLWDSVAASREYEATGGDAGALEHAEHAFDAVQEGNAYYARGACPEIRYQQPFGGRTQLKTLETDSNYVKAALLLYQATRHGAYLDDAKATYAAIRAQFLDPRVPLYTVYVFDDGTRCSQLPHRFFGSVNGNMILDGLLLARATGDQSYREEAITTAQAVTQQLADARGIYADLQAENDIGEPLVEAMYDVATQAGQPFARTWLLRNAGAAISAYAPGGYGRFFDGPPPQGTVTAWQTNAGFALMLAAAAVDQSGRPTTNAWASATYVAHDVSSLPATLTFTGSGIALLGTIGERCCEAGHARVFIDGQETFDHTGIWQDKSSSGRSLTHAVLFAWQWPASGTHTLTFQPGLANAKEGGSFLHLVGYDLLASRVARRTDDLRPTSRGPFCRGSTVPGRCTVRMSGCVWLPAGASAARALQSWAVQQWASRYVCAWRAENTRRIARRLQRGCRKSSSSEAESPALLQPMSCGGGLAAGRPSLSSPAAIASSSGWACHGYPSVIAWAGSPSPFPGPSSDRASAFARHTSTPFSPASTWYRCQMAISTTTTC